MRYGARVYGLRLRSDLPLAGAAPLEKRSPFDLSLRLCTGPLRSVAALAELEWQQHFAIRSGDGVTTRVWSSGRADGTFQRLTYDGDSDDKGIDFVIDPKATRVWILLRPATAAAATTLSDLSSIVLGPVCGLVLRLRGILALHASAVVVGSRAIVLLGRKGAGKSSLAAALIDRGCRVLSDDLTAMSSTSPVVVQPGYPRLRLWPEALEALVGPTARLAPVLSSAEKRYLDLTSDSDEAAFQAEPAPLAALYLLTRHGDLEQPTITPVAPAAAVGILREHIVAAMVPLDRDRRAQEFYRVTELARQVPLRRLRIPDRWAHLPAACDALLASIPQAPAPAFSA